MLLLLVSCPSPPPVQADAMYLRNKEELESLQAKRTQVENDRRQISAVISELDVQKKAALEDTWRKVGVCVWLGEGGGTRV
jgi:chromosome segregation ATPase